MNYQFVLLENGFTLSEKVNLMFDMESCAVQASPVIVNSLLNM